jgi:hypothetical protein
MKFGLGIKEDQAQPQPPSEQQTNRPPHYPEPTQTETPKFETRETLETVPEHPEESEEPKDSEDPKECVSEGCETPEDIELKECSTKGEYDEACAEDQNDLSKS